MNTVNECINFRIHEDIGATKFYERYAICDSANGEILATAREEVDLCIKIQKLFLCKSLLPVRITMEDSSGKPFLYIVQLRSVFRSVFSLNDPSDNRIALLRQKFLPFRSEIEVLDSYNKSIGTISGDWWNRNFSYFDTSGRESAVIKHIYGGLTKELLTTADDYQVETSCDKSLVPIILASAICIDVMFHE